MRQGKSLIFVDNLLAVVTTTDKVPFLTCVHVRMRALKDIIGRFRVQFAAIPSCTGEGATGPLGGGTELVCVINVVLEDFVDGARVGVTAGVEVITGVEVASGSEGSGPTQPTQYS